MLINNVIPQFLDHKYEIFIKSIIKTICTCFSKPHLNLADRTSIDKLCAEKIKEILKCDLSL